MPLVRGSRRDGLDRLRELLERLYGSHGAVLAAELMSHPLQCQRTGNRPWTSATAVLITYADGVQAPGRPSLAVLHDLLEGPLAGMFPVLHVLPFLRSTSDGGFAIRDHQRLESRFGDWGDLARLGSRRLLMADLVLNHVSSAHRWVQEFRRGVAPGRDMVLCPGSEDGWEEVVRPRSSALFTEVDTVAGPRRLWTTFGPDQVDLNWRNPAVLREFVGQMDRLLAYGVRWIRLDAVGFLWKEPHTRCIHLPPVHDLVRVLRLLLESRAPAGVLVSETNVPEEENLSYLRSGDEAQLAYNFPLPPLLLEAMISGRGDLLNRWLARWPGLPAGTALLNFAACHDGVGLRPLEGLMEPERIERLLRACAARGGLISHRRRPDGTDAPYEINIAWWSAMGGVGPVDDPRQLERFLCSQLLLLALPGVPAFYLPAVLASGNDHRAHAASGHRRDLHRERFPLERLERRLADPEDPAVRILAALRRALAVREGLAALDPEAPMECLSADRSEVVLLKRGTGAEAVWAVHNLTAERVNLPLHRLAESAGGGREGWRDLLADRPLAAGAAFLDPYAVKWLQPGP